MSQKRSVTHATFTIERTYPVSAARVFHALSDAKAKKRWFNGPAEWSNPRYELDFRIGGREVNTGGPEGGPLHAYFATYLDIVPDARVVYCYDMYLDETRISVSLATMELKPAEGGTRLVFTEQGAYLDGWDDVAERKRGTEYLLDALGMSLVAN